MSFNYKNPITPLSTLGNISVQRKNVFGTNFSILSTGGYMEVYNIDELYYTIPPATTGLIEYSGNTIPLQLNKGTGSPFSFDVLTLNSDNISSGRRRLGMLVYVIDEDQVYQYQIPNFISLWNSATGATGLGGNTVIFSDFGTTVKSNTPEGVAFISAWTSNVIEGVSGGTSINSTWKKLVTGGGTFTGGTVTGDTIFTSGLTATTFSASTYLGLPGDIFITGGTFDNNTDTLTLDRSSGSSITVTGFTDYYTTAFTYSDNTFTLYDNSGSTFPVTVNDLTGLTINGILSASTISGGTYYGDGANLTGVIFTGGTVTGDTNFTGGLSANTFSASTYLGLPIDVYVTGGTYSAGTSTFTNNTGGTFDVLGFYTGETDDNIYVTGFTYSSNTFTISDNSGSTFDASFNDVTGLTINGDLSVTGNTNVDGLTANTISATTYQNLPIDPDTYVTGFTYSSNTLTIYDNSGTTFPVTINDFTGLTIYGTLSATTYQNLPTDIRVTGATYSNNTFTYTNNTGGTFNVNFNTVTGLTVNGNLSVTGNTTLKAFSGTSGYISGSGQNILTIVGSGNSTTSPLFSVQGSNGELFSISDSLIGSLFSVNDISGLPILEVFSDNTTLMGSYLSPSLNTTTKVSLTAGTNTIYSIPTSAYTGAFFDYTLISTGSTGARAGNIISLWSGSTAQYTETSTNDIGTTTGVTFSVAVSGSNAVLSSSATTAGWTVKTIVRSI